MHEFGSETIKVLSKGGWYIGRDVDIQPFIELYKINGFPVLENVLNFLRTYGDLKFNFRNLQHGDQDDFNFNIERALEIEVWERIVEDYMPRTGNVSMAIIGTAYREHFILLMDKEGKVYGAYDSFVVKIADSGEAAIEAIVTNAPFDEIPELDN